MSYIYIRKTFTYQNHQFAPGVWVVEDWFADQTSAWITEKRARNATGDEITAYEAHQNEGDGSGGGVAWGSITGTIANQSDLQDALNERIPVESAGMDANIDVISDGGARLRLDDTANVMSATGTSGFNASEEVMTIGDWNGSNNSTVLRVDDNAQTVEVDAPAGLFVNSQEVSPFGFRDIVSTADFHVYPAASNSRTYYRIAGDNRTFHLPTTSLIAGKTMFYVTFTGSMGLVDAGAGFTVDAFYFDGTPSGAVNQRVIQAIFGGHMFMVWYIGSNNWASTIINSA